MNHDRHEGEWQEGDDSMGDAEGNVDGCFLVLPVAGQVASNKDCTLCDGPAR
jgi:hypothetical protein